MSIARLNVLNPGGRDPNQSFADGVPAPSRGGHAPVNFHAYAACTGGAFLRDVEAARADDAPVLLLLRGDVRQSLDVVGRLKDGGRTVLVSFKETGTHQTAQALGTPAILARLKRVGELADGFLAPVPWLVPVFRALARSPERVAFVPTPYPVGEAGWDFSCPLDGRRGIFVGTREFRVPTRRHAAALAAAALAARATGAPVGVFNTEGGMGRKFIREIAGDAPVVVHEMPLPYPEYLRLAASHRIVLQMDASEVPGQVAGDALLCGMPCLGGNGAVESIAFPEFSGAAAAGALIESAARLLKDDDAWRAAVADSRRIARERLAFPAIAARLREVLATIRG